MLEDMTDSRRAATLNMKVESDRAIRKQAEKPKINLSDKEFGKY